MNEYRSEYQQAFDDLAVAWKEFIDTLVMLRKELFMYFLIMIFVSIVSVAIGYQCKSEHINILKEENLALKEESLHDKMEMEHLKQELEVKDFEGVKYIVPTKNNQ